MKNNSSSMCPLCGGRKTKGTTTFTAELGSGVVVVRRVPASICSQCGEEWISDATVQDIEAIVVDARARRLQVEVTALR